MLIKKIGDKIGKMEELIEKNKIEKEKNKILKNPPYIKDSIINSYKHLDRHRN
jgi:hypothetical protein